jgi:glycosyltransferase involved in cell wall biosynthesis
LAEQFYQKYPELLGRNLVVFLGRLHPKKGLDLLIPAFAEVLRSDPNAQLVMIGQGEKTYVQSIHDMAGRLGLSQRVLFMGHVPVDVKWQALAAGAVFALPSYQENFAMSVAEAMSSGLPVVLSRQVNIWKEVTESGAGLACDLTAASIADTILKYLKDPALRAAAAARGQRLVSDKFNWDRSTEALEKVYKQVLEKP